MQNVRHILRTKTKSENGVLICEQNVYYPKLKKDKNSIMGDDYSIGDTYKRTTKDGSRVLFGYGIKEQTGELFIPKKGYRVKSQTFIPSKNYKSSNYYTSKHEIIYLKGGK